MLWAEDFVEAIDKVDSAPLAIRKNLLIAIVFSIQQPAQEMVLQLWDEVLRIFVKPVSLAWKEPCSHGKPGCQEHFGGILPS